MKGKNNHIENDGWDIILNSLKDPAFIITSNFDIKKLNTGAKELLKAENINNKTQKCYDLICKAQSPSENCPLACKKGDHAKDIQIINLGSQKFQAFATPITEPGKEQKLHLYILKNISELNPETFHYNQQDNNRLSESNPKGSPSGNWEFNVEGNKLICAHEVLNIFESKLDDTAGLDCFLQFVHPDDKNEIQLKRHSALMGTAYDIEYRIIVNGKVKWIRENAQLSFDSKANGQKIIGTIIDITICKEKEQKLFESENKFRMLFDNMNSAFALHKIIVDEDGVPTDYRFIEANPMFENLTGLKVEEIKGKRVLEVLPNLEIYWIETYGKVALGGSSTEYTNYAKELDKHYEVKIYSPLKDYFAVTFYDVTERIKAHETLQKQNNDFKKANLEIREKEHLLASIFNSAPVIMLLLDEQAKITNINEIGINSTQRDRYSILGLKNGDLFRCVNAVNNPKGCGFSSYCSNCDIRQITEDTLQSGRSYFKIESKLLVEENGKQIEKTVQVSTAKIQQDGNTNILVTIDDITERKEIENELIRSKDKAEESDRLKTTFLANMSHEIRTPLNGILGFTDLLASRESIDKEQKKWYGSIIKKSSEGLLSIIDNILNLSKVESGSLDIDYQNFDINEVIMGLYGSYSKKVNDLKKDIVFQRSEKQENPLINADKYWLLNIFQILLDNAIKFTQKGIISFGVEKAENDTIFFFVEDTGIGIEKEVQSTIFERFRQGDERRNRTFGGNGIGLAIAKKALSLLDGEIWVDSTPNQGSRFTFTLPQHELQTLNTNASDEFDSKILFKPISSSLNILVVEDDEINWLFLQEILSDIYPNLSIAWTGPQAIEMTKQGSFDVILMDIQLPGISGLEVTKQIRKYNKKVHIIAQTAYAYEEDRVMALQSGCDDFMEKPLDSDLLLSKLGALKPIGKPE